jgi:beta-glucanase (GH16 family)
MKMKENIIAILLLTAVVLPAAADDGVHSGATDGYELVWNDEFNGTALNEDAWNIEVNGNGGGNAELQYYKRDNVVLGADPQSGAGCLILKARRESYGGKSFTSGRLNSNDKVTFTRGKIESRIKMPSTANGLWPAFWLLGANFGSVGWPRCGEIDIVEMGNAEGISKGTQDRFFNGACHWGYYNSQGQYPNYAKSTTNSYSIQDGEFHLFTLVWDENYISMYLDLDKNPNEEPYYRMGVSDTNGDWATGNYFQHDFFIVYDLAVGGYFTNILSPSAITAVGSSDVNMYIDWVRVYQKSSDKNAIVPDNWTDGIKNVTHSSSVSSSVTHIYDLSGRRLETMPDNQMVIVKSPVGTRKFFNRKGREFNF